MFCRRAKKIIAGNNAIIADKKSNVTKSGPPKYKLPNSVHIINHGACEVSYCRHKVLGCMYPAGNQKIAATTHAISQCEYEPEEDRL